MEKDPIDGLLGMRVTLESARTANSAIEFSHDAWKNKKPLNKEHFWEIRERMKQFKKELEELDNAVKRLPIDFRPTSVDERIEYHNSLVAIPDRYLEKIEKYESGHNPKDDDVYMFFANYQLLLDGVNDRAVGIKKAVDILNEDNSIQNLRKESIDAVLWADSYFREGKDIPSNEKEPHRIANLIYSYLFISNPIDIPSGEAEGYKLLDRVAIGNPDAWRTVYNKINSRFSSKSLFGYIKDIHTKYEDGILPKKNFDGTTREWQDYLCGPAMLATLFASDVMRMKLREGISLTRKTEDVSYIT